MVFLHNTLRLLLASVFLVAGSVKLFALSDFSQSVGDFGLVPDGFVNQTAVLVIIVELLVGMWVAFNLRWNLIGVLLLLGLFFAVLTYGIVLGLDIHCGCFGPSIRVSLTSQLMMDVGLVVLTGAVFWSGAVCRKNQSTVIPRE